MEKGWKRPKTGWSRKKANLVKSLDGEEKTNENNNKNNNQNDTNIENDDEKKRSISKSRSGRFRPSIDCVPIKTSIYGDAFKNC